MHANSMCMSCMLSRQEKNIRQLHDDEKKSEYMHQVLGILYEYGQTKSSPHLAEQINRLYEKYWGSLQDFSQIKYQYNKLLLDRELDITEKINKAADPIKEAIKYVCAANYIDFSAVENVNEDTFQKLLEKAESESVPESEYAKFKADLGAAESLVYLTDNCGEIVLDKIWIALIKKAYPNLKITVIVRGGNVINDATLEDAKEVGLTEIVPCIDNGNAAPGTVPERLSEEAKNLLSNADVIISKGQGNFESLYDEGFNPYYMFLCKCELFVHRFGLKRYESVFRKEERISILQ